MARHRVDKEKLVASPRAARVGVHLIDPPEHWNLVDQSTDGAAWMYDRQPMLSVILSIDTIDGKEWMHISVAHGSRVPTYKDLAFVKQQFIGDDRHAILVLPDAAHEVPIETYCLKLHVCLDGHPLPEFNNEVWDYK